MASPAITNAPQTISTAESTTGWAGTSLNLDPDIRREGTNSVASTLRANNSTNLYSGANLPAALNQQTIRLWCTNSLTPYMRSFAEQGFSLVVNTGSLGYYTVAGFDTYNGGWLNIAITVSSTVSPTSGTVTATNNVSQIGVRFRRNSAPRNINNTWLDYLRYGDGYTVTGGTAGDPITPVTIAASDNASGYGIFERKDGVVFGSGMLEIGAGATATDFDSVGDVIVFLENQYTRSSLYKIAAVGSGCNVLFDGSVVKTAGNLTNNKFDFDFSDTAPTVTVTGCLLDKAETCTFATGQSITLNTFNQCGSILPSGATFTGNTIKDSTGSASVTCTIAQIATVTNNTFESDGSNHAVELTGTAASFTWDNDSTGYASGSTGSPITPTSTGNETIFVNIASGTITINVADGAAIPSIRSAGATVNVVAGQRTFTVTVKNIDTGSALENARVYVTAAAGGGLSEGTVIIDKVLTDASGQVSDTRSYGSDQPYTGSIRLASLGNYYKATSISGTISSSTNTSINVSLIPDD